MSGSEILVFHRFLHIRMYIPQCECNTANVQNKASVAGVVHMKGTITAGIWIKETNLSADHILVWSPLPCCRAGDVVRHCVGTKLFLGSLTFFCERICRLKPERHLECCLINVLANILVWSSTQLKDNLLTKNIRIRQAWNTYKLWVFLGLQIIFDSGQNFSLMTLFM